LRPVRALAFERFGDARDMLMQAPLGDQRTRQHGHKHENHTAAATTSIAKRKLQRQEYDTDE